MLIRLTKRLTHDVLKGWLRVKLNCYAVHLYISNTKVAVKWLVLFEYVIYMLYVCIAKLAALVHIEYNNTTIRLPRLYLFHICV